MAMRAREDGKPGLVDWDAVRGYTSAVSKVTRAAVDSLLKADPFGQGIKLGGTSDFLATSMIGASVLSTAPLFSTMMTRWPFGILPLSSISLGTAWTVWRMLEGMRRTHVLPSTLNIASDEAVPTPEKRFSTDGLLVGYTCDGGEPIIIDNEHLMRHLFIEGQSGVGKTVAASTLMFQQIQRGGGLCFIDPKIDLENILLIYHYCCYTGRQHDFLCLNPDEPERSNTYSPVLWGDRDEIADAILLLIPSTDGNAGADHYKQEAKQAINTIIGALQRAGLAYNVIDIVVLLMSAKALEDLERQLKNRAPGSEELRAFTLFLDKFRKMVGQGDEKVLTLDMDKLKNTFGGIGGRLFSFGTGNFGKIMNTYEPEVNMFDVVRGNKILYVALPTMGKGITASNFGKLLVADMRRAIARLQKLPKSQRPNPAFMFFVDEAGSIATESWDILPEQMRSAGVFFVTAVQTVDGLRNVSEKTYQTIIGNAWTKLFFKIGTYTSAEEAAKTIGERMNVVKSMSDAQSESQSGSFASVNPIGSVSGGSGFSVSERQQEGYIISPTELMGLDKGECVMLYGGNRIYDLRIPMLEFTKAQREEFGDFLINRYRSKGIVNEHGQRLTPANYFTNSERFMTQAQSSAGPSSGGGRNQGGGKRLSKEERAAREREAQQNDEFETFEGP
ncbi:MULTISPECIES: type IV secretory system conjugative DNA transfer family protein [Burkholderia cepacia complex]|uniref:type IV secretory system conjugative DNA transfer family protein n=1 Tax=Burkholderia cepacia complex TaxID=87882 RepID=UPI0009C18406|nr:MULTISPECIES: type IV secretion system DNA-binding domain-containing protein [Burkholderia cepacia complex]MBR8189057.1 type IV secretion system DNA-binding domain-containing protein [Burkholderia vietnamiensis]